MSDHNCPTCKEPITQDHPDDCCQTRLGGFVCGVQVLLAGTTDDPHVCAGVDCITPDDYGCIADLVQECLDRKRADDNDLPTNSLDSIDDEERVPTFTRVDGICDCLYPTEWVRASCGGWACDNCVKAPRTWERSVFLGRPGWTTSYDGEYLTVFSGDGRAIKNRCRPDEDIDCMKMVAAALDQQRDNGAPPMLHPLSHGAQLSADLAEVASMPPHRDGCICVVVGGLVIAGSDDALDGLSADNPCLVHNGADVSSLLPPNAPPTMSPGARRMVDELLGATLDPAIPPARGPAPDPNNPIPVEAVTTGKCATCRFCKLHPHRPHEECRRSAPVVLANCEGQTAWPLVNPTDWCGDHEPAPQQYTGEPIDLSKQVEEMIEYIETSFGRSLPESTKDSIRQRVLGQPTKNEDTDQ